MAKIADSRPTGSTTERQIASFEKYIGFSLPADYRRFLLEHNGGRPVPDAFMIRNDRRKEEDIVHCFFPLRSRSLGHVEGDELREWPLHCAWDDLQNDLKNLYEKELDPPLLPIGTDGSGNYISLVLAGDKAGAVVFLEHELAEDQPLASSFTKFLDSLKPRRRTDYADDL